MLVTLINVGDTYQCQWQRCGMRAPVETRRPIVHWCHRLPTTISRATPPSVDSQHNTFYPASKCKQPQY